MSISAIVMEVMTVFDYQGIIQPWYRAVDEGDIAGLLGRIAPEFTYYRPGYRPIVGSAELEHFYRHTRKIKNGVHHLSAIIGSTDQVAVRGHFAGVLKDESPTQVDFADFFVLDAQGLFRERHTFFYVAAV
jgi:ketosteroid isomerase-like protein